MFIWLFMGSTHLNIFEKKFFAAAIIGGLLSGS